MPLLPLFQGSKSTEGVACKRVSNTSSIRRKAWGERSEKEDDGKAISRGMAKNKIRNGRRDDNLLT